MRSWTGDPLAWSLLGVGAVAAGVGVGVLVSSFAPVRQAREQDYANYGAHEAGLDGAGDRRLVGALLIGGGSALLVGGVVRAIVVHGEPDDIALAIDVTPHFAGARYRGAFSW
jgi:hypothetical protein